MNFTTSLLLLVVILNCLLALLVLGKSSNKKVKYFYAATTFSGALWSLSLLIAYILPNNQDITPFFKFIFVGPTLIPLFSLFLSKYFPFEQGTRKDILYVIPPLVILALLPTNFIIKSAHKDLDGHLLAIRNIGNTIFAVYLYSYMTLGIFNFLKKLKISTAADKARVKYVLLGVLFTFIFAPIPNLILPLLGYTKFNFTGPIGFLFFISFTAYAIIWHKLMDIRVFIRRYVASGITLAAYATGYYLLNIIPVTEAYKYWFNFGYLFFCTLFFLFLRKKLTTEIDHYEVMYNFVKESANKSERVELVEAVRKHLIEVAGYEKCAIYSLDDNVYRLNVSMFESGEMPEYYEKSSILVRPMVDKYQQVRYFFLPKENAHLIKETEIDLAEEIGYEVIFDSKGYKEGIHIFKICKDTATVGLVFLSGNLPMRKPVKQVTENMLTQVAVSFFNAYYIEQLERARKELTKKVDAQTKELRERNKQLEKTIKEVEETRDLMMQTSRDAAIGRVAGGIAHEIKNPLAGLEALLGRVKKDPESIHLHYDRAMVGIRHIFTIVRSLLNAFHHSHINQTKLNLKTVVEESLILFELSLAGNKIRITKELADVYVHASAADVQQCILNIMYNARDAITMDKTKASGAIILRTQRVNEKSILTIIDDGMGMKEEVKLRIFEPYFTTKEIGQGTGIGLYGAKTLLKKNSAEIECESEPGKGTTFTMTFSKAYEEGTETTGGEQHAVSHTNNIDS